ncbi:MAG TPA: DNA polymerase III subunit chi [Sphingomicrobium sp.]|nr:DNA polymerase III subunit chi [Sphingomicrobium sp.]
MRVDFYQLGTVALEQVIAKLAEKLLGEEERLLVVAADDAQVARLERVLWEHGGATSFLPHGTAGGSEDSRQPVLLSTSPDAANRARNLLIADGHWREAALAFHRAFYVFGTDTLEEARATWRSLGGRDGIERHYWANEDGRWVEKAAAARPAA